MSFRGLDRWLEPRVVVPLLLGAALLIFALSISNVSQVIARIRGVPPEAVVQVAVLAALYLSVKAILFKILLAGLDIHPGWRRLLLAFSVGEMTLIIPSGLYAQNYVLQRLHVAGFARSAAATTAILVGEGLLVALGVSVVGVPGWPWLAPAVIGIVAGLVLTLAFPLSSHRLRRAVERLSGRGRYGFVFGGLLDLGDGLRAVAVPRLLGAVLVLVAIYLAAVIGSFVAMAHGTGNPEVGFTEACSIYFFSLGVTLMLGGVLGQLGVIEVAGLGAARAWGIGVNDALAMFLAFRIAWMGCIWLLTGTTLLVLWGEFDRPREGSIDHGRQEAAN